MSAMETVRSAIAPRHEDLWHRAGAKEEFVEIEPGHTEIVPFFDARVDQSRSVAHEPEPVLDRLHRQVGEMHHYDIVLEDGVDRSARVYLPQESDRSDSPFMIHMDTPWFTSTKGHNNRIAEIFMQEIGVPVVVVGPEYSTTQGRLPRELARLAQTAMGSTSISLSRSAEGSMAIASHLAAEHELPRSIVKVGESRGAMLAMGERPYAEANDLEILYYDVTDPCVAQRVLQQRGDVLKLARWPLKEAVGSLAVAAALLPHGGLTHKIGTVSTNPNFLVAAMMGVGPALLSGEAGEFPYRVPTDAGIHIVNFKRNTMADASVWREKFEMHENFELVELKGPHMGLAYPSVQRHVVERIKRFDEEFLRQGGQLQAVDWQNVYTRKRSNHLRQVA